MADKAPHIPVMREPIDRLRHGDRSLRLEAMAPHPVEQIQALHVKNSLEADFYRMDRVYGKHVTWEKRMDIAALSAVRRLPGLPSSYSGLDTMLGRDDKLTFEDTLNAPHLRPEMPKMDVHDVMERTLAL